MATITTTLIRNRLGITITAPPALTNTAPTTGDIGADGTTQTPSNLQTVFEITFTSTGAGDTFQIVKPSTLQRGLGCCIELTPMNAAAITSQTSVTEAPTTFTVSCNAAAVGALFQVKLDALYSASR